MNVDDKTLPYVQCQYRKPWVFFGKLSSGWTNSLSKRLSGVTLIVSWRFNAFLTFTSFFLSSWLPTISLILHFNVPLSSILILQVSKELSRLQYSTTWGVTWACHLVTILLSLRNSMSLCALLLCDVPAAGSPTAIEDPSPVGYINASGHYQKGGNAIIQ